ncbi:hypothetical protein [Mocis latipes granulovirus]|uniref:Uncharacterized protein n=1 Tax=Mocis latipes granulovirus TaxID=2072024 RepID=A0A161C735_9BBAC|nr:hypothetical protein [Mocis latipes granulovirus]AKR17465.2 hypothetical protein [Mocis latipes granulovirus]
MQWHILTQHLQPQPPSGSPKFSVVSILSKQLSQQNPIDTIMLGCILEIYLKSVCLLHVCYHCFV